MSIITNLWYGDIDPQESGIFDAPEIREMTRKAIKMRDPCVGSGAMLLGFANAMSTHRCDYTARMRATATDIDLKCVHMAYIRTSLYGIPSVIVHGNSLTLAEWSHWFTPAMCRVLATENETKSTVAAV